jgi:hypothetical protein
MVAAARWDQTAGFVLPVAAVALATKIPSTAIPTTAGANRQLLAGGACNISL